jgi:hypothetical protein
MPHSQGYARYVVSNTVLTLRSTPAAGVVLPGSAATCLIQNVDPANILAWSDDPGNPPSATEGLQLRPGETLVYDGELAEFAMIRAGATDVTSVRVLYYSQT